MVRVGTLNMPQALDALFHPVVLFVLLLLVTVRAFAGSATLAWDPISNPALAGYMLYYGPTAGSYTSKIDAGNTTTGTVPNLTEGATYHFAVTAYDASRTESSFSNDASTTIPFGAPVANFNASATSGVAPLVLNFTSTSTGSISTYAWTFGDSTSSTSQSPSHVYSTAGVFTVSLTVTGSGGSSTKTIPNYVTVTPPSDTSPPTAPSSLAASAGGASSVNLSWNASTDNISVTGYRIERCQGAGCTTFGQLATSTGTTFSDSGLASSTSYSYRVRATDAAGNLSAYSSTATATTSAAAVAPIAGFSGSPTSGTSPLTVNFTTSSTGTISSYAWNFGDGTASASQNPSHVYSATGAYTVSLTVSGSAGSNTKTLTNYVTVTTAGDTSPPTAPTNVASSANGSNGIDLSWNASTDNVGVTSYRIERCQNAGCVTFAEIATSTGTTFSNSGLTANTSYSYRIRAADAAGNFSPYSNTSTATTLAAPSTGSGSLSGTWAASSGTIDLTTLGASDWVQWPSYERKSSGGKQISDFTPIGTSKAKSYADDRRVMMWTDGMPATTGSTNGAVLISGPRNGFQIVAPADTTVRTLTVYVSAQNATGTLTAQLSDGSAVDYANTFAAQKQASEGVYTLTYQAASAGQHITVKWMQTSSSGKAYVSLQGAALK